MDKEENSMSLENETIKQLVSKILDKMQTLDSMDVKMEGIEKDIKNLSSNLNDMDKKMDISSERLTRLETNFNNMQFNYEKLEKRHFDDINTIHNKFRDFKPELTEHIKETIKTNTTIVGQKNKIWALGGILGFLSAAGGAVAAIIFK